MFAADKIQAHFLKICPYPTVFRNISFILKTEIFSLNAICNFRHNSRFLLYCLVFRINFKNLGMLEAARQSCDRSIILKLRVMQKITAFLVKALDRGLPTPHLGISSSTDEKRLGIG
jgi:hypothetical protein